MCSRLCLCLFLVSVTVELSLSGVLFMMLLDVDDNVIGVYLTLCNGHCALLLMNRILISSTPVPSSIFILDVDDSSAVHVSVVVAPEVISLSLSLFIDYVVTRVIALLGVLVMICASVLVISGVVVHVLFLSSLIMSTALYGLY